MVYKQIRQDLPHAILSQHLVEQESILLMRRYLEIFLAYGYDVMIK